LTLSPTRSGLISTNTKLNFQVRQLRRECLDFVIPINEAHIRQALKAWTTHYNSARPHSSLGPRAPDPNTKKAELQSLRHCIPKGYRIVATSILSGLHHEYRLEKIGA
jgi:hypothetical protein